MSSSLRRGAIAAVVLAAIVPLSACSAGNNADTQQVKPDTPATSIGDNLKLNNIVVVTKPDGQTGVAGPATITVNVSNTGSTDEALQSVTLGQGNTPATFTDAKGLPATEVVIPAGGSVLFGGAGQPSVQFASISITVGGVEPATFTFKQAGKVTAQAQVTPARGPYASFGPSVAPLATASASASAAVSAAASAGASASATPAAGASASPAAPAAATPAATTSASASASAH